MKTRKQIFKLATIGVVAAFAFVGSSVVAAPAAKTIRVLSAKDIDAASPQAAIWQKAPVTVVALQPAFAGHPSVVGTPATAKLNAQAVRAGNQLYVRLAWSDHTANTAIKGTDKFIDRVAMQFPMNGKAATTPFMGDANNAVNVWHWRADGLTENLFAKGYGTSMPAPFDGLRSNSMRTDDGWAVVFMRPLQAKPDEGANLAGKKATPIAFAAWDGDNQERDGLKAVTLEWLQLRF